MLWKRIDSNTFFTNQPGPQRCGPRVDPPIDPAIGPRSTRITTAYLKLSHTSIISIAYNHILLPFLYKPQFHISHKLDYPRNNNPSVTSSMHRAIILAQILY